jgi:predicted alpha/beta hydrolase
MLITAIGQPQDRSGAGDEEVRVMQVTFKAGGHVLGGTFFKPAKQPRAVLVLNGATGVKQTYYRDFAHWLAETQNLAVLTYDYRDFGASLEGSLRDSDATMEGWALVDQPAARDAARALCPDIPLWVLGHSLGAMTLPMQRGIEDIERVVAVASGFVHTSDHPWPYQGLARLFWHGHFPVLTKVLGYLPGRMLGFGEDLPAGVYWEWRRWCTSRSYFVDRIAHGTLPAPRWDRCGAPMRLVAVSDDAVVPPAIVARLAETYAHCTVEHSVLDPAEYGLDTVGHLAVFRKRNAAMWPDVIGDVAQ